MAGGGARPDAVIGVDWGTTNLRAFQLRNGAVAEMRASAAGVSRIEQARFGETLRELIGDWVAAGEDRILLTGMIGSRQGWSETRPVPCPARIDDLVGGLGSVAFDGACVRLVPGVADVDASGVPEVMRGEETQIIGAGLTQGWVCLPGSHSKWAQVAGGAIAAFTTYFTGETFAALGGHTILGRLMRPGVPVAPAAFDDGVARSAESGGLLHHLFGVRTLGIAGRLAETESALYLSGLLIGHEVRAARPAAGDVTVIGEATLATLYARAIAACGGSARVYDGDASAQGLAAIAERVVWPQ